MAVVRKLGERGASVLSGGSAEAGGGGEVSGILPYREGGEVPFVFDEGNLKLCSALDAGAWEDEVFDLTVTSPPYNVNLGYNAQDDGGTYADYLLFMEKWLENVYRWTKPHGRLCVNIPLDKNKLGKQAVGADVTDIARRVNWRYQTTIIWNEGTISRRTAWGSWMSASAPSIIAPVELIVVFSKGDWKKTPKGESTIGKEEFMEWTLGMWTFNGESAKRVGHPAPFPLELPKRCIRLFSYKGDAVFDPFAGSGTTLAQAVRDGRRAYGNEIDADYRRLALGRIGEAGRVAVLDGEGALSSSIRAV